MHCLGGSRLNPWCTMYLAVRTPCGWWGSFLCIPPHPPTPYFGEARFFSPSKGPHSSSLQIGMVPSDSAVFFQTLQGAYPNWSQKRMGKDLISSGLLLHLNRKGRASQAFLTTPNTLRDLVLALHPLFSNSPLSPESQDSGWHPPPFPDSGVRAVLGATGPPQA